jgi:amidase
MAGSEFAETWLAGAGIGTLHAAMLGGRLTARRLVELSLEQIHRNDQAGPALNAVVTFNDAALEEADELDRALVRGDGLTGALHGIPMLVKDSIETKGIATAFGSEPFADYVPERDAKVVEAIRSAGAIVLAKTTLPDWAASFFSDSSRSGHTKNPYDTSRHAGGSSAGTGAGLAAGYAPVGLGTDTGGSVRLPASFCNLVGVRSTPGLISRSGCSPLVGVQDTVGPMGHTVADVVRVFDVLVGFDPADPLTSRYWAARPPKSYLGALAVDGLEGMRIGVLRDAFGAGDDPQAAPVNDVIDDALHAFAAGGATVTETAFPELGDWLTRCRPIVLQRGKHDIDQFLRERPSAPMQSVAEIVKSRSYHEGSDLLTALAGGPDDPADDPAYHEVNAARADFSHAVLTLMARAGLHALVYPTCQVLPPTKADTDSGVWTTLNFPTNTLISSQTGFPALTIPAGLTGDGLPVGLEILVRPYDEPTMFRVGYAFEQIALRRCTKPIFA